MKKGLWLIVLYKQYANGDHRSFYTHYYKKRGLYIYFNISFYHVKGERYEMKIPLKDVMSIRFIEGTDKKFI